MVGWRYQRGLRDRSPGSGPGPETAPPTPREIPWANAVRTTGACTHDVIYSECNCPDANIRAQTNPSDFRADQRR